MTPRPLPTVLTFVACLSALMFSVGSAAADKPGSAQPAAEWQTTAERTGYVETGRYADVVAYGRHLAAASDWVRLESFGTSGEGRALPLLVLSSDQSFTPEKHRASGKLCVLVTNCIHAGECAGKDASLALARDIAIDGRGKHLLEHVNLLIMPIFSVDGHERFGPFSRLNQVGPKEMGWRVNAVNLNLNRDFAKADAVEMQGWIRTWVAWRPDLMFDNHTTDGSDHRYTLLYSGTTTELVGEPIRDWFNETLYPAILPPLEAAGHGPFPYGGPVNRRDFTKGFNAYLAYSPRYSTGYAAVCNRAAFLVEAHALKTYEQRVKATYAILWETLEELNRHPDKLRSAIAQADREAIATRGADSANGEVVLQTGRSDGGTPIVFKGVKVNVRESEITGTEIIEYSDEPVDVETTLYAGTEVTKTVAPAMAYLIPPQWTEVIARLDLHGVSYFRLGKSAELEVDSYRFEDVTFAERPFESRTMPKYTTIPTTETRAFVAGTVVVPTDQPRAKLAAHLLEPEAPDSLLAWGLMNAIFEQKEYAETYAMEPIARRMLAEDADLRAEFEQKLASDPEFASAPRRRLYFFYERSPYWDVRFNRYPIARLMNAGAVEALRAAGK